MDRHNTHGRSAEVDNMSGMEAWNGAGPAYLDCNSTTPAERRVLDAMIPAFSELSGNLAKPSFQTTVTNPAGHERRSVVSLKPGQKARTEKITNAALSGMRKDGFSPRDLGALIAMPSSRLDR